MRLFRHLLRQEQEQLTQMLKQVRILKQEFREETA